MNKTEIISTMRGTIAKVGFALRKQSPEILAAVGVVGTVASAIIACRATTKIETVLEEHEELMEAVHNQPKDTEVYTEEDAKKDTAIIFAKTGIGLAKLYAPAVILGVFSIGSLLASNNILRKRNAAMVAAYTTIDKAFKKYRKGVVERFGDRVDYELRHGIKVEEIKEKVKDENGKEKTVKKKIDLMDGEPSCYSKFFDDGNPYWQKNAEYNLMFLRQRQNFCNDRLKADGFLFLNDAYDALGIPRTKAGQVVGWIYDEDNPIGDNYVDFGLYNIYSNRSANRDFVNGYEPVILLDFNVDGPILELMN